MGYKLYYRMNPDVWSEFNHASDDEEAIDMATKSMAHRSMDDIAWLYRTTGVTHSNRELVKVIHGGVQRPRPW